MFNLENFVANCRLAVEADPTHLTVHEIMERSFSDPASILAAIPASILAAVGDPKSSGLVPIYCSKDLTIVNVIWKPGLSVMPHNHSMWAVIGIYGGREDNIFWRRVKDDPEGRIEAAGAKALCTGDVTPLGKDIIHSVNNPIQKLTGAIHVYGGDFFEAERSEWDSEHLTEHPYDTSKVKALFAS